MEHAATPQHLYHSSYGSLNRSITKSIRQKERKSVRFSHIEIREYEIILGDHPGGMIVNGSSVSLGWNYNVTEPTQINSFELEKDMKGRRDFEHLALSKYEREDLLREFGWARSYIEESIKQKIQIQNQRKRSLKKSVREIVHNRVSSLLHLAPKKLKISSPKIPNLQISKNTS